ncbi:hypothetical protein BSI_37020 [Bacillus inaquosorum KCTC 13429]|uniref:Uncharacterized protein n=1 Tax=Bacillus inaquosorum KCTC 13429 TaxID=1236548 RepID=A0A9W5PBJ3_9BACI|nr:hypothetical protein BSI_37020 [Bacillus inaquosorum KCTC 13429]
MIEYFIYSVKKRVSFSLCFFQVVIYFFFCFFIQRIFLDN